MSLNLSVEQKQGFDYKNHSQCYCNKFIANVLALFWCHFQQAVKNSRDLHSGID